MSVAEKVQQLPHQPGCYLYKNAAGVIVYIGKAKDLRKRVSSYFQKDHADWKTNALVQEIADIDYILTDNELGALFLEARLIKDHQPKYNIDLKGGVRYAYLRFTDEPIPRLETARVIAPTDKVYGPFARGSVRQSLLRLANDVLRLRVGKRQPDKVGEQYRISISSPPWRRTVTQQEYAADIVKADLLLRGKMNDLESTLLAEMQEFAQQQSYELAKMRRDQLSALAAVHERQNVQLKKSYNQDIVNFVQVADRTEVQLFTVSKGVVSGKKNFSLAHFALHDFIRQYYFANEVPEEVVIAEEVVDQDLLEQYLTKLSGRRVRIIVPKRGDKRQLLELVKKNITARLRHGEADVWELQRALDLPRPPRRIECFDISNLGSTFIVASMVSFYDGAADKKNYRKFRIRYVGGQSDVDAMTEVVGRRYQRLLAEHKEMPDLVLIDGGKPQLGAALEALARLKLVLPIAALAKQEEELFLPDRSDSVRLPKSSPALHLVQRVRDEAHRFAITYHRLLRSKNLKKPSR